MIFTANVSGYQVTYDNNSEAYQVLEGEAVVKESKSFEAINKYIDTGGEKKAKPKRINKEAIKNDYNGYQKIIITSIAELSRYGSQVWTMCNGKREKQSLKYLFDYTPENMAVIGQIAEIGKEIKELNGKQDKLALTLTRITPEMLQSQEAD